MKLRALIMLVAVIQVSCCGIGDYRRTGTQKISATIIEKHTRQSNRLTGRSRRYYVVIEYEKYRVVINNQLAYESNQIGDPYPACLATYTEQTSKKTYLALEPCPEPD
jgi:hypothetical protein